MPDFTNPELMQCADCQHHFQVSPRGEIQVGACPDCGGKRMFRMQPNPVQSEGTLRNMVDMETGKDAGGNPDGEGILAPSSGRSILTAFIGDELECPTCHLRTSEINCPRCGTFIDPTGIASEHSGVPAELRSQIPGAPLTEGTIVGADDTPPYDTGNRGRDEYTHSRIKKADNQNYRMHHTAPGPEDTPLIDLEQNAPDIYTHPHYYRTGEDQYDNESFAAIHRARGNPDTLITIHRAAPVNQINTGDWVSLSHGYAKREGMHPSDPKQDLPVWSTKVPASSLFWDGNSIHEFGYHGPKISNPELRDMGAEPNKHGAAVKTISRLKCPQCGDVIKGDPGMKELYCPNCDSGWPIRREMSELQELHPADAIRDLYETPDVPTGQWTQQIPKRQGKTSSEMEDILGIGNPTPRTNLNWTSGMKGRGIVIGGEPHTWNTIDPNKVLESNDIGLLHPQYVETLGVDPQHVDWNTGIEIDPDGKVIATGGHDFAPFIAADPRLKHVEDKFFSFSSAMPTLSRTNNMEPYESLWAREADVQFDRGPLQNTPNDAELDRNLGDKQWAEDYPEEEQEPKKPGYSVVVQPSEAGVHGAHTGRKGILSFLDAHVNGIPVRGHGGELITKYGFRSSPDFGKPLVVAVHDPAHLPIAVESLQHPRGISTSIGDLIPKIQSGEVAVPPGIDAQTLDPLPGVMQPATAHTAGLWGDLGAAALTTGGLALAIPTGGADLPEVAAGDAALIGGDAAASGVADAAAGEAASKTTGGLMNKAMSGARGTAKAEGVSSLVNQGVGMAGNMLGAGEGAQQGGGGAGYSGPLQQFTHVLAAFVESDYETPASNPDVGVKHDDPEDVDQKEFNDQDKSPENPMNPNLQDSGASGEDEVRKDMDKPAQGQFSPEGPAIQRLEMLMPLIEKYYHSDESGANDPMLKGLHEMLEAENPGYLTRADEQAAERFMQNRKKPGEHVHATVHEAILPPMQQGNLQAQQQALDPTALNPSLQPGAPSSQTPPGGAHQQGHCPNCGGVTQADGSCPQCGAAAAPQAQPLLGGPSIGTPQQTFAHTDLLSFLVEAANHQGPVTPEQIAAVQQYLIQQGRVDEVPNVPLDPGNPEYAKILSEIQNNPTTPPTVTPEEQTQPPAPQPAAPGGMPVPGMAPGESGGQPMQPISSFLPDLEFIAADNDKIEIPEGRIAADNIAPRCPKCGSATTGIVGDADHHAKCHSCQNVWKLNNMLSDENYGQTSIAKVVLGDEHQRGGQNEQANPIGVPAAQQSEQTNQGGDQDSSLTWADTLGAPLKAGQTYQMVNPSFSLPDLIRVERVKPDGIDVTLLGTYSNDPGQQNPNMLTSSTPISKEDAQLQQLAFEPIEQNADDRNNEPPPGSQAPGHAQVPPSGQTTDEVDAQQPDMSAHSSFEHDLDCPRCGHREFTSAMISPESKEHSCFFCGHDWVTEEKSMEHTATIDLEWLNEDDDIENFSSRRDEMSQASQESRNLSSIANKDKRLRAVKDHLDHAKAERKERTAGRHFTPKEQRELIDEDGYARNSDMLELDGTHYKSSKEQERVNADNAPDSHLFLGI